MKRHSIIKVISLSSIFALIGACGITFAIHSQRLTEVKAYTSTSISSVKNIDLNDCTEAEIREYYSALNDLPESERQGTNLLKSLKPILKNGQKYFSYDSGSLWAMYEITDRDWVKSPASAISGYDAATNTITGYSYGSSATNPGTNPYIHALYVDREVDNNVRAWQKTGTTSSSHGNNAEWCIDQEHIWPKSQGFNAGGKGGARGDPMHLWPGDSDVNSSLHNDQFYGFVNITSGTKKGKWDYGKGNYVGTSLTLGTTISTENVFEPQDTDKGDIARAIFYLVARYNYLSGEDSDGIDSNNPNLELVQSNEVLSGYTSSTTNTGKMGILTDLLEWHHLDPVDEFEIHRNNLVYKNYSNNRNPFIDFPEWVDYIWGTATYNERTYVSYDNTPTGRASPINDVVNGYNAGEKEVSKIEVTKMPAKLEYTVGDKFDKTGMVVTATFVDDSTADVTSKCSFTVDMASAGEKDVTVSYKGKTTSFKINVAAKKSIFETIPWWVWIIVAVVVVAVIIGIACGVLKVNKKGKIKVSKSGVKKVVKGSKKKK